MRRIILGLSLLMAPLLAVAEEAASTPMYVAATNLTVSGHPGAQSRFETFIKRAAEAHAKLDTKRYWFAWQQEMGNPRSYTLARTFSSMSAMDEAPMNPISEAFGPDEIAKLTPDHEVVASVERGVWVQRPDLAVMPDSPVGQRVIWLQATVKAGENERFEAYVAKVAEATREVAPEVRYATFAPVFGSQNTYVFSVPTSYAQLDEGPVMSVSERLRKAFGEREARRLEAERAATVESLVQLLTRPRPDLAYQPPAEE
jgi:hypothetical protein